MLLGAVAIFVSICWLIARGRSLGGVGAFALLWAAILWLPFNRPVEGPILTRLGHDKGLTLADLLTLAAIAVAIWRSTSASNSERARREPIERESTAVTGITSP